MRTEWQTLTELRLNKKWNDLNLTELEVNNVISSEMNKN